MTKQQAVYTIALIGRALEDAGPFFEKLQAELGTRGIEILHETEMALATEFNLEVYRPEPKNDQH